MKVEEIKKRTKEAVDHLIAALEAGQSDVLMQYLGAMARFHNYSFGNVMLIASQKPTATSVAGVRTWNSLGRFVRRGEKGILILAPMIRNRSLRQQETAASEQATEDQKLLGFRAVYVFDISQTEGKELPALTEVRGEVSGYRERLFKLVETQNIDLIYSEDIAPPKARLTAGRSRCSPECSLPKSFPPWCMRLPTRCCIGASGVL